MKIISFFGLAFQYYLLMKKPHYIFKVSILYKDDKRKEYESTDSPGIGDNWITLYQYSKRIMIPAQGIAEIEYDIISV